MEDNHSRVIVHIDIDCFYAQVEMNKNPTLKDRPMGVQQKNIVVTCNYPARARGVGKCMYLTEAKELCPELVLVNGEDLAEYRRVSAAVYSTLCETGSQVERLGMDENWLDVTQMVKVRTRENLEQCDNYRGNVFGDYACEECDCVRSLNLGTMIAEELRRILKERHGLTSSAGISHNKLLSKLVGGRHKPDDQTAVAPAGVLELLQPDKLVTTIPGIGRRTGELLADSGISSLQQLRKASLDFLMSAGIPKSQAETIQGYAWGRDRSEVKMSGKPGSVGLEDRFLGIYNKEECKEKLQWLLGRLVLLLAEDGRKPTNIKVTVRDYYKDKIVKKFHKESRQTKISPRLFQLAEGGGLKAENQDKGDGLKAEHQEKGDGLKAEDQEQGSELKVEHQKEGDGLKAEHQEKGGGLRAEHQEEILETCLGLLGKMIDFSDAFHITLLGLSVTDFLETVEKKSSIKNFFISPKKEGLPLSVPTGEVKPRALLGAGKRKAEEAQTVVKKQRENTCRSSNSSKSSNSSNSSPDKDRNQNIVSTENKGCPAEYDPLVWNELPQSMRDEILEGVNQSRSSKSPPSSRMCDTPAYKDPELESVECPKGYDPEVFNQLPSDIQKEFATRKASPVPKSMGSKTPSSGANKSKGKRVSGSAMKSEEKNSILNYFSKK